MDLRSAPFGIRLFHSIVKRPATIRTQSNWYKYFTLLVTFFIYCVYHVSRKPISVVKDALNPDCNKTEYIEGLKNCTPGWPPFNDKDGNTYFSYLDSGFLLAYAVGMFITGHIAERMNLRTFLVIGMVLSGISTAMFGLGRYFNIHVLWYYILVQTVCGLFQSSGWPPVVNVVANWFGKGKRGLVMGVWNSHSSLGNIIGSVIAAAFVDYNWGLSFIVPGVLIVAVALFIVLPLLIPHPLDIGLDTERHVYTGPPPLGHPSSALVNTGDEYEPLVTSTDDDDERRGSESPPLISQEEPEAISFCRALRIPGVVEFSVCLFFAKLVSYTFLFWLPNYISKTTSHSSSFSALLSTLFDFGGIAGAIIAGVISDSTGGPALTCFIMLLFSCPFLFLYNIFGSHAVGLDCALLLICGALVNGPYALITTAISADLGCHKSLRGNAKALSTVSAIIDGTGSLGAAIGPAITGFMAHSNGNNWAPMFYMLIGSEIVAMLNLESDVIQQKHSLLVRLCFKELQNFTAGRRGSADRNNSNTENM